MSALVRRRRRKNGTAERFVLLTHYMLKSRAWRTLSPNAKALLIDVWQRHNGINNGDINYAVREAEDIGLSKDQASRAFTELIQRGFLKVARNSAFTLKTKEARTWTLTGEELAGRAATKDFMHWLPDAERSLQRGCDVRHESKTRSHQRDPQSHRRDGDPENRLQSFRSPR